MVSLRKLAGLETDEDREIAVAARVGIMFLVVLYLSFDEIRYTVWGETAVARVVADSELTGVPSENSPLVYVLTDGQQNQYKGRLPQNRPELNDNGKVMIDYLPGKTHKSRIAGDRNWIALGLLAVAFIVAGAMIYPIYKEASDYTNSRNSKR